MGALVALLGWLSLRIQLTVLTGWLRPPSGCAGRFPVAFPVEREPPAPGTLEA